MVGTRTENGVVGAGIWDYVPATPMTSPPTHQVRILDGSNFFLGEREKMNAYLSIDLDYWMHHGTHNHATEFIKKVLSLRVPTVVVIEHEELVPYINKVLRKDIVYNVDYHSDIVSKDDICRSKNPMDCNWANYVRGRTKAEFCWIVPEEECYTYELGTCHGDFENDPFCPQKNSGWRKCTWSTDLDLIAWKSIKAAGICISPLYIKTMPISGALKVLGIDMRRVKEFIRSARRCNIKKRDRGTLRSFWGHTK